MFKWRHNSHYINHFFFHSIQDGKRFLFEMGQWLRSRYGNFLGNTYHPDVCLIFKNNRSIFPYYCKQQMILSDYLCKSYLKYLFFMRIIIEIFSLSWFAVSLGSNNWCNTNKNVHASSPCWSISTTWNGIGMGICFFLKFLNYYFFLFFIYLL